MFQQLLSQSETLSLWAALHLRLLLLPKVILGREEVSVLLKATIIILYENIIALSLLN